MDARTTPFTRMQSLAIGYRAERDMLAALDRGDAAGERVLDRILRALGVEQDRPAPRDLTPVA
jgi:hypothetical protein